MTLNPERASLRVLALGAYLKNRACLIDSDNLYWSPMHGDLKDPKACQALSDSVEHLIDISTGPLDLIVHDMHPDFYSTVLAQKISASQAIDCIAVQHHHAHIGAVMAEYGLSGSVLGLALDGAGWGEDQTIWGGEMLLVDGANCKRLGHLARLALPGGDAGALEPWRMAVSALLATGRGDEILSRLGRRISSERIEMVRSMLVNGVNAPLTSSAGRWFDVAAALLGLCDVQAHDAQAAQLLEGAAQKWLSKYPITHKECESKVIDDSNPNNENGLRGRAIITEDLTLDLAPLLDALLTRDQRIVESEVDVGRKAAEFHLNLVSGLVEWVIKALGRNPGIKRVCLSGGCFHNKILKTRLKDALEAIQLEVYLPRDEKELTLGGGERSLQSKHALANKGLGKELVGCGDAGIALGQAWVGVQYLTHSQTAI